jgi:hypothetical protein
MSRALPVSVCLIAFGSGSAWAAPPQLYDKAISVSFSVAVNARAEDGSSAQPRQVARTIYVSSKGRLFTRLSRQAGRNSQTLERGPETTAGAFRFQGNNLIGVLKLPSGASQLTITFDPSYSSCSASVAYGRESGRAVKFTGLNGKTYTMEGKPSVSTVSCSIRQGNPFA